MKNNLQINKPLLKRVIFYLSISLLVFVILFPVIYMFSSSFLTRANFLSTPIKLLPTSFYYKNYIELFSKSNFQQYIFNSTLIAAIVVISNIVFSPLVGYGFAKFRFPGRNILFFFILATMMIPFNVIVIPLYLIIRKIGWINTYQGIIAPQIVTAFNIFLMRQFIGSIPNDYIDAARIDGCSEFKIFLRIIFPLSRPAITTVMILTLVNNWNMLMWPLIILTSEKKKTLPVVLTGFLSIYGNEWNSLMAASVISSIPVLVFFFIFSSYFIKGMSGLSGLKE